MEPRYTPQMSWINDAVVALEGGREVEVRPRGGSMRGLIEDNQPVRLQPVSPEAVRAGDVVFIRWKGNHLLHIALELEDGRVKIGNNLGKVNGWAAASDILGRAVGIRKESSPTVP